MSHIDKLDMGNHCQCSLRMLRLMTIHECFHGHPGALAWVTTGREGRWGHPRDLGLPELVGELFGIGADTILLGVYFHEVTIQFSQRRIDDQLCGNKSRLVEVFIFKAPSNLVECL